MSITLIKPFFLFTWLCIPLFWFLIRRNTINRRPVSAYLRSILILLLGLILSEPRMLKSSEQVNLFFCVDGSESVGHENEKTAEDFIRRASKGIKREDLAGLIVFGEKPSIEIDLKNDFSYSIPRSQVNKNYTNIHDALRLAIGRFPEKGSSRIVLLSDGNQNLKDAVETAWLSNSLGIEVFSVPLASWYNKGEVFIEELITPSIVSLEAPFEIRLTVMSTDQNEGELLLLKNNLPAANQHVILKPGKNIFRFTDALKEHGLYQYRCVINPKQDTFFQNNEGISFTKGTRKSTVLYVSQDSVLPGPPAHALKTQGIDITFKQAKDFPRSSHGLFDYNAVILDNVPAPAISYIAMENLEKYVKDMGGGLIVIGGDRSFGAGQYLKTPLEKTLPVFMDTPTTMELSGICIVMIIDKSSSMGASYVAGSKLEMAKIAAFSTVEMLNPLDSVGILAFDSEFRWIVPISRVKERKGIALKLSELNEEGGTILHPPLKDAFKALKNIKAAKKHVVVLTDGAVEDANFESLIRQMKQAGITLSTVAVGTGSAINMLGRMAKWGGGRGYYTENIENIPRIFIDETRIVTQKLIVEKEMQPISKARNQIIRGIPTDSLPLIYGHVTTYPKSRASVLFETGEGPLLAAWQYGLGRSVAFTSDLSGRWGKEWAEWDYYGKFLSQMVRWAQRKETQSNYVTTIERNGREGTFSVDVTDNQNRFVNNLNLSINVLLPSKTNRLIHMDQTAAGKYMGSFSAEEIGEYYFSMFESNSKGAFKSEIFGFGIPYTDEFSSRDINHKLLKRLADITGAKVLSPEDNPAELFKTVSGKKDYGRHLWPYLAILFLLLLVIDVTVRKFLDFSSKKAGREA